MTARKPAKPKPGPTLTAVEADLKRLPAELARSAIAATALAMARELDDAGNSATSKAMCAARLIEAMERLRTLAPKKPGATKLDDIKVQREKRLARQATS